MFQGRQPTNAEIASLLGLGNAPAPSMARPQFSFPAPRFVPTGTIKPTPKTIAGSIQATIAKGLQKVGVGDRQAHRFAARYMLPLTDATPVGNVTGAEEGKNTFKRGLTKGDLGTMALGAASFLLSAAPLSGAIKRGGKKLGTGMFGSMLKDKSGAIRAWHGSPHDFDKFEWSPRTRGTGEGAQAYGDGLYFAENPEVAKEYQRILAYNGADWDNPGFAAGYWADRLGGIAPARDYMRKMLASNKKAQPGGDHSVTEQALAMLERGEVGKPTKAGRLYEVNINAEPEDFLDWDSGVWGQSPKVTGALEQLGLPRQPWRGNEAGLPGDLAYQELIQRQMDERRVLGLVAEHQAKVGTTEALKRTGLPGIRFLDQGSRAAGQGTANYVVFDDKLIDILNKY